MVEKSLEADQELEKYKMMLKFGQESCQNVQGELHPTEISAFEPFARKGASVNAQIKQIKQESL